MLDGWRVGVVIPARNEEASIREVLETLPKHVDLAVVINDGSTDRTAKEANDAKAPCEVIVLEKTGNGVGASIDAGHRCLLERLARPFVSVVMAGDGQMNPDDMVGLSGQFWTETPFHMSGKQKAAHARLWRHASLQETRLGGAGLFTSLAAGQSIQDPQCGYTATSSKVLDHWDWKRSWKGYGYPNFWLIHLSRGGWRIAERPVQSIYRNETSGIRPLYFPERWHHDGR